METMWKARKHIFCRLFTINAVILYVAIFWVFVSRWFSAGLAANDAVKVKPFQWGKLSFLDADERRRQTNALLKLTWVQTNSTSHKSFLQKRVLLQNVWKSPGWLFYSDRMKSNPPNVSHLLRSWNDVVSFFWGSFLQVEMSLGSLEVVFRAAHFSPFVVFGAFQTTTSHFCPFITEMASICPPPFLFSPPSLLF